MSNATTITNAGSDSDKPSITNDKSDTTNVQSENEGRANTSNLYVFIAVIVFIATIIPLLRKDNISDIMKTSNLKLIPILLMCIYVFYKRIFNRGDIPELLKGVLILIFLALCFFIVIYFAADSVISNDDLI